MQIIVDGYNLMWTTRTLNPVARFKFGKAKGLLTRMMDKYAEESGDDVVLVYDGYKGSSPYTRRYDEDNIEVVVTARGMNADRWIMDTVGRNGFEGAVVSSDREIVKYVKSQGIEVITSRTFENRVMDELKDNKEFMDEIHEAKRHFKQIHQKRHGRKRSKSW